MENKINEQSLLVATKKLMLERIKFCKDIFDSMGHKGLFDWNNWIEPPFTRISSIVEAKNVAELSVLYIDILNGNTFDVKSHLSSNTLNEYQFKITSKRLDDEYNTIVKYLKSSTQMYVSNMFLETASGAKFYRDTMGFGVRSILDFPVETFSIDGMEEHDERSKKFLNEFKACTMEIQQLKLRNIS